MAAVAALLAATALLPQGWQWLAALAAIVLLGVPHGALDGEIARPLLRPRWGRTWLAVFAPPYLALAAAVLLGWRVAPLGTLAAFLAVSVLHFGLEDAGPKPLEASLRGALPIAAPLLLHPAATARVFGMVALVPLASPPLWLMGPAWVWAAAGVLWVVGRLWRGEGRALAEPLGLVALFALLPPLTGFAIYFVAIHAPRHTRALVASARAPRVTSLAAARHRAVPLTAVTLLIGACLWRWFPGPAPDRLLALTIQSLAALTLPHLLLEAWSSRCVRPLPSPALAPAPVRALEAAGDAGCRMHPAPGNAR